MAKFDSVIQTLRNEIWTMEEALDKDKLMPEYLKEAYLADITEHELAIQHLENYEIMKNIEEEHY